MPSNFTIKDVNDTDELFVLRSSTSLNFYRQLYAFGFNANGQLGDSSTSSKSSPVQIGSLTTWKQADASKSGNYSLAVRNDGTLWGWGENGSYQLGTGNTTDRQSPVQIGTADNWLQVTAGGFEGSALSLGIRQDGSMWAWGLNTGGRLGDGTTIHRFTPWQIGGFTVGWSQLSAGGNHALAVKTDNTLWSWGSSDQYGQLGSTRSGPISPVQVGSLTDWVQVSAGSLHSTAVKTDGTLWTWGSNEFGQLGDGTRTHRSSPVQIGALTNWSRVSAGGSHSLAVKTDGTLWAWGWNNSGRLGDGTTTSRSSPVQVGALTSWSQIFAGISQSLAVKTDGTLWAWGVNSSGELGIGDRFSRNSPTQVGSLTSWSQVSTGGGHTLALKLI